MLVGRKDIIDHIQREALKKEGGSILFIGQRRSGKTSVLKNLKRPAVRNIFVRALPDQLARNCIFQKGSS